MGMAMGGTGGGGRRGRGRRRVQPVSEINVTPFVDVMLVLLIVFMVSAPLLTVGVPVDLPETQARQIEAQTEPITISVTKDGQIFLMETEIDVEDVVTRLEAIAAEGTEARIFVRGDRDADYGTVLQVMARISAAGFHRIALVSAPQTGG